MAFLRFVIARLDEDSGVETGLFSVASELCHNIDTHTSDRDGLITELEWFATHLPVPKRFNRSSSKGYYRRAAKGICWFKDSAQEAIVRMYVVKRIVEHYGHAVDVVKEDRVSFIVHEDEMQVVAEPFADTRTGT